MAGSAIMDPDVLVDDLVGSLIDDLRDDLHSEFGVRAYRTFTVARVYLSGAIDGGPFTDTEVELIPAPLVKPFTGSLGNEMDDCGLDEAGTVELREISLTYTEAELTGGVLDDGVEWFIRVKEGHGQLQTTRDFVHDAPPYPDRIKDMGWTLKLRVVT